MLTYLQRQKHQNYIIPIGRNPKIQESMKWCISSPENNCQPRIIYPVKWKEIKTFQDNYKLKQCTMTRRYLKESFTQRRKKVTNKRAWKWKIYKKNRQVPMRNQSRPIQYTFNLQRWKKRTNSNRINWGKKKKKNYRYWIWGIRRQKWTSAPTPHESTVSPTSCKGTCGFTTYGPLRMPHNATRLISRRLSQNCICSCVYVKKPLYSWLLHLPSPTVCFYKDISFFLNYFIIYMCIQHLDHLSPLPLPLPYHPLRHLPFPHSTKIFQKAIPPLTPNSPPQQKGPNKKPPL
jgi:hypothetical protein